MKEALMLALEALQDLLDQTETPSDRNCSCHIAPPCSDCVDYEGIRYAIKQAQNTITAIKEALAQPEQESVRLQCVTCGTVYADGVPPQVAQVPVKRPWVGLTDEEKNQVAWSCGAMSADWLEFSEAIEAKLKEKNQ